MQIVRRMAQPLVTGAVFGILLAALTLLSASLENSAQFGRLYSAVLVLTAIGVVALAGLIGLNLFRLVQQYRAGAPGSRPLSLAVSGRKRSSTPKKMARRPWNHQWLFSRFLNCS